MSFQSGGRRKVCVILRSILACLSRKSKVEKKLLISFSP